MDIAGDLTAATAVLQDERLPARDRRQVEGVPGLLPADIS